MKRITSTIALLLISLSLFAQTPKYVFYFIGDGMGINHAYATEKFNEAMGLPPVNFFHFPVRTFVNTWSASGYVTDSAAGGSALATGTKVNNGSIAIAPDGTKLTSIAERANKSGYATGVISSGPITDATPAVFYAKAEKRGLSTTISQQLIDSKLDFFAGPSFQQEKGSTYDTQYWEKEAKAAGMEVFHGKDEYTKTKNRVLMLSNRYEYALPYAIDRQDCHTKLADFTAAGIDYLYNKSPKGFFLMVEGGKIDYCAHANDAATIVREVNDLCESIDLALQFYEKHPKETLIIVVADHETGGFTMGGPNYSQDPALLANQKISIDGLTYLLYLLQHRGDFVDWSEVQDLFRENLGFWDAVYVSDEQTSWLNQLYKEAFIDGDVKTEKNLKSVNQKLAVEAINYLDSRAGYVFKNGAHTGAPLGLYVKGPKATEFLKCTENTDVPTTIAKIAKYK